MQPASPVLASECYWQQHRDILPQSVGLVAMVGLGSDDRIATLDYHIKQRKLSVIFDARQQAAGKYAWQLSLADEQCCVVGQLEASQPDILTLAAFGNQGQLESVVRDVDSELTWRYWRVLAHILNHSLVRQDAQERRQRRVTLQADLDQFKDENQAKFGIPLWAKRLREKEKTSREAGFVPLKPRQLFTKTRSSRQTE